MVSRVKSDPVRKGACADIESAYYGDQLEMSNPYISLTATLPKGFEQRGAAPCEARNKINALTRVLVLKAGI